MRPARRDRSGPAQRSARTRVVALALALALAPACSDLGRRDATVAPVPSAIPTFNELVVSNPPIPPTTPEQDLQSRMSTELTTISVTTIEADAATWAGMGIQPTRPWLLSAGELAALSAQARAAPTRATTRTFPSASVQAFQAVHLVMISPNAYVRGQDLAHGQTTPLIAQLITGGICDIRVHADAARDIVVDHLSVRVVEWLGADVLTFPAIIGADHRPATCEEPVVTASAVGAPRPGMAVGPGHVLALPMSPPGIKRVPALEARRSLGACTVEPLTITQEVTARLARRTVAFFSFSTAWRPPPARFTSMGTRLDGVVVTVHARDAPLVEVLRQLARQLPEPTVACFDLHAYQHAVTISVDAEPLPSVLERLLSQTDLGAAERCESLVIAPLDGLRTSAWRDSGLTPTVLYCPPWVSPDMAVARANVLPP